MLCSFCGGDAGPATLCPKAITCPRCDAAPGRKCHRPSGHVCDVHSERYEASERADELMREANARAALIVP
jgi:hypothetical protein